MAKVKNKNKQNPKLVDLLLCPQFFIRVEYDETLKCLGDSFRHLVYLAVKTVLHAPGLRSQFQYYLHEHIAFRCSHRPYFLKR